jgi:hypothetical protein
MVYLQFETHSIKVDSQDALAELWLRLGFANSNVFIDPTIHIDVDVNRPAWHCILYTCDATGHPDLTTKHFKTYRPITAKPPLGLCEVCGRTACHIINNYGSSPGIIIAEDVTVLGRKLWRSLGLPDNLVRMQLCCHCEEYVNCVYDYESANVALVQDCDCMPIEEGSDYRV